MLINQVYAVFKDVNEGVGLISVGGRGGREDGEVALAATHRVAAAADARSHRLEYKE